MKKRIISLLIVVTMGASLLSGCGCSRKETKATVNLENLKKADKKITKLLESDDYKEASDKKKLEMAEDAVKKLAEDDVVVKSTITVVEEYGAVTFQYDGGGAGTIQTVPLQPETDKEPEEPTKKDVDKVIDKVEEEAKKEDVEIIEEQEEIPAIKDTEAEWSKQDDPVVEVVTDPRPGEFRIRIFNAFEDNDYRNNNYRMVREIWKEVGMDMSNVEYDDDVKIEELLEMKDYSMVSFSMHGSITWKGKNALTPVIILLDDEISSKRDKELQKYLANYEVIKFYGTSGFCYAATPEFFDNNFKSGSLDYTIIYSETCCFLGDCENYECDKKKGKFCDSFMEEFPSALCNAGAPAVMGFHNSVYADYAVNGLVYFGAIMDAGYTAETAFAAFINDCGETDRRNASTGHTAYPLLYGNNIACTAASLTKGDVQAPPKEEETTIPEPDTEPEKPQAPDPEPSADLPVGQGGVPFIDSYYQADFEEFALQYDSAYYYGDILASDMLRASGVDVDIPYDSLDATAKYQAADSSGNLCEVTDYIVQYDDEQMAQQYCCDIYERMTNVTVPDPSALVPNTAYLIEHSNMQYYIFYVKYEASSGAILYVASFSQWKKL